MKLKGDHVLDAPRDLVWRALLDPEVLRKTLPGCEDLKEVGENQYAGRLKMKVGPVQGVFEGGVQLSDLDPPNGYDLTIEGKGPPGFMNGSGTLKLEDDPGGTKLFYEIDAQVGGRIASIGQRLVESSAKVITKQGLKGLDKQIQGLKEAEGVDTASAAPADAPEEEPAPGPAGDEPTTDTAPERHESAASAETPSAEATSGPTGRDEHAPASAEAAPSNAEDTGGRAAPLLIAVALLAVAAVFVFLRGCGGG